MASEWYTPNLISEEIIVTHRDHFVSNYINHSWVRTIELLTKNMGKVILIEEAHLLVCNTYDSFGREVIYAIMDFLEEHPGQIGIILSGDHDLLTNGLFKWFPKLLNFFLLDEHIKEPEVN